MEIIDSIAVVVGYIAIGVIAFSHFHILACSYGSCFLGRLLRILLF